MENLNNDHINSDTFRKEKFTVLCHVNSDYLEGNYRYISLLEILCEVYNRIFKLDIHFTKSLSYQNCNVLIENLPKLVYGINNVSRESIHIFLKKVVGIDRISEIESIDNETQKEAYEVEKVIFTDLQLFISVYNYNLKRYKYSVFKTLFRLMYQPYQFLKTYLNDRKFINEFKRVFEITNNDEVNLIINYNR